MLSWDLGGHLDNFFKKMADQPWILYIVSFVLSLLSTSVLVLYVPSAYWFCFLNYEPMLEHPNKVLEKIVIFVSSGEMHEAVLVKQLSSFFCLPHLLCMEIMVFQLLIAGHWSWKSVGTYFYLTSWLFWGFTLGLL